MEISRRAQQHKRGVFVFLCVCVFAQGHLCLFSLEFLQFSGSQNSNFGAINPLTGESVSECEGVGRHCPSCSARLARQRAK